jgi:hypothetical protein
MQFYSLEGIPVPAHNNTRLSPAYYESVLRLLIACNTDAMTYAAMAETLNKQGITSPTGLQWTSEIVKQLMKKLRNYRLYPSFIHQSLLELVFEGKLTLKETLPLYQTRRGVA